MVHRLLTSISLTFLVTASAFCQYEIELEENTVRISDGKFSVVGIRDIRNQKNNIGFIHKGLMNARKIAIIEGSFEEEVLKIFVQNESSDELILAVTDLQVSEVIKATAEFGYAHVKFHVLKVDDLGYIHLGLFEFKAERRGMDVTKKHPDNISAAFQGAIDKVTKKDLESKNNRLITSLDELLEQSDNRWTDLPVVDLSECRPGLYRTFTSFRNNQPDSIAAFELRGSNMPSLHILNEEEKSRKHKGSPFFAVVDESDVYIGFEGGYYKTTSRNGKWLFVGPKTSDPEAVSSGAMIGGLIGAGIAAAASNEQFVYQISTKDGSKRAVKEVR